MVIKAFTESVRLNTGLAKVAVQCSADTFVDNQSLVHATVGKPHITTHLQWAEFRSPQTVLCL